MPLSISINRTNQPNANSGWEIVEVSSYTQLATLMRQYSYASSKFDIKRDANNANSFNNLLIFDVDNDPKDRELSIIEAKELLEKIGISAMILASKSHQIEKFTDSGKSKGIKDRYRIIIPTKRAIRDNTDKETYREFQELVVNALELNGCVDTNALKDKARFYYKSPLEVIPIVIRANRVMDISNLENRAIENIQKSKANREAQNIKREEIRANAKRDRVVSTPVSNTLTFVDVDALMDISIGNLIKRFENSIESRDGSYIYIKTDNSKYSIIDNRLAYDFKSDITYNSITYLQMQYETDNLNIIAREYGKITNENYIIPNIEAIKKAIIKALIVATNDKSFEDSIKLYFGVNFVKLKKESLQIADQEISLRDTIDKRQIIKSLKVNREVMKSKDEK